MTGPADKPIELKTVGEQLAARDVVRQGIYQVTTPAGRTPVAVNLLSDRGTKPLERSGIA